MVQAEYKCPPGPFLVIGHICKYELRQIYDFLIIITITIKINCKGMLQSHKVHNRC